MSILKKRDDAESKTLAQLQQRQSKRRVRFQEMDDSLDQGISVMFFTVPFTQFTDYLHSQTI